jgi:hypothetical protein
MFLTCTGLDAAGVPVWVNSKKRRIKVKLGSILTFHYINGEKFPVSYFRARYPLGKGVKFHYYLWDGESGGGFAPIAGNEQVDYIPSKNPT